MGLNESGGAVLRWKIFRIFELWCFVESAVLKRPAFVKPRNVSSTPYGNHFVPLKSGLRFSRKALRPSLASSVM